MAERALQFFVPTYREFEQRRFLGAGGNRRKNKTKSGAI